ncbi:hypothetical protein D3C81_752530 [compost metagenome]
MIHTVGSGQAGVDIMRVIGKCEEIIMMLQRRLQRFFRSTGCVMRNIRMIMRRSVVVVASGEAFRHLEHPGLRRLIAKPVFDNNHDSMLADTQVIVAGQLQLHGSIRDDSLGRIGLPIDQQGS